MNMDPINYQLNIRDPFESAIRGYQFVSQMRQQELQQQQQQIALQQQRQMQQDLAQLAANKTPTSQDYAAIITKYPQLSDHVKRAWDLVGEDQKAAKLADFSQVYSAMLNGNADVAQQLLDRQAQAYRNSGRDADAQHIETISKLIPLDPKNAEDSTALMLSSIMGPKDFTSTFKTLQDQRRERELAPAALQIKEAEAKIKGTEAANAPEKSALENANIKSQIEERSNRLGLDKDKLQSETELKIYELNQKAGELPESAKKIVNESAIAATAADQASRQSEDLAGRLEKEGMSAGVGAKGAELYKSITGNQDAISALRQEYTRIRAQGVMKSLPPGPASDKDVQMAQKGFPEDTASPSVMASFLRGLAKVQKYEAASKSAEAEWVNAVGHMGKPKTDIVIDGITVPKGSTYVDFTRQYLDRMVKQDTTQQGQSQIQSRPYWKYATGAQ